MIYTYNETDIPFWDVVDKNEHFYRIKTKSSDIKNGFGIDIIKNTIRQRPAFESKHGIGTY